MRNSTKPIPRPPKNEYFIDTHAHLHFPELDLKREEIIKRASEQKVKKIINVATGMNDSPISLNIAQENENIFSSVGVHPHEADQLDEEELSRLSQEKKCCAIGEIGLDYFKMRNEKETQIKAFEKQLNLASKKNLPVIIHSRKASQDVLSILKNFPSLQGVFHCFSGGKNTARKVLEMGFLISFTGILTFPNAENARQVLGAIDLSRIMLETDCPFLSPQRFRGQTNEPSYLLEIAQKISTIKKISLDKLAQITTQNAEVLFGI